jgi:Hypervirulence associated proteins TUDOR domain
LGCTSQIQLHARSNVLNWVAQLRVGEDEMGKRFKVGDHVTWNSEAGQVSGRIVKVHSKDVDYKGHTHHASEDEPQYEIKSDKTDHIAMHKGSALKKLRTK